MGAMAWLIIMCGLAMALIALVNPALMAEVLGKPNGAQGRAPW
jgi:hypothetical protein